MEINKLFDNIMDLPGIEGVCLFGTEGQMYINRLPSFLSTELFADAQRRIVAMYETMDENFIPSDDYMLKFSERWLLLRRTDKHVMLILGGERANLASTRMVTNMTMKHLTPELMAQIAANARGATGAAPLSAAGKTLTASPFPPSKTSATVPPMSTVSAAPFVSQTSTTAAPTAEPAKAVRMYRGRPY